MNRGFQLIEAAAGGNPRVSGVAYSGGKMALAGWKHPVIVDLQGLEIPSTVPLLANHENRTTARVGMVTASVTGGALEISGEIVSGTDEAKEIVAQGKAGSDWQLSIGADVRTCTLVQSGTAEVNGQSHEAPFYHITQSVLREVSVVAVGADASTSLKVTAEFNLSKPNGGENSMPKDSQKTNPSGKEPASGAPPASGGEPAAPAVTAADVEAAVKAERKRVADIRAICNGECPDIESEAVSAGWSPEATSVKVLEAVRAGRPAASVNLSVKSRPEGSEMRRTIEAALCLRSGISADSLQKSYDDRTIEAAMVEMDMPLRQMLIECMNMEGVPYGRGFDNDTIRAAFSTVSLPGILSNVANKRLLQSYEAQPIIATRLCSAGDLNDFKENDRFRLTDVGDLVPVAADGEIKDGGVLEESAKNQLDTYGKKFCLTRKMIINDDLGSFMKVPAAVGNRAARLIDQLFFGRLLRNPVQPDGKALFSNAHRNLLSGASSALGADSLKKAIQLFMDQVDADGQPIAIEPSYLLVPTALKHLAIELTKGATLIMGGGSGQTVRPALNVLADENLQVVSSPYLANSAYAGFSDAAWYLFGNPQSIDTWEIGYLKGKRTPTVERGATDFNTLGLWFRVYFDIGVREQDHRGMTKANGAAGN